MIINEIYSLLFDFLKNIPEESTFFIIIFVKRICGSNSLLKMKIFIKKETFNY